MESTTTKSSSSRYSYSATYPVRPREILSWPADQWMPLENQQCVEYQVARLLGRGRILEEKKFD
jgi:hypothetical protein